MYSVQRTVCKVYIIECTMCKVYIAHCISVQRCIPAEHAIAPPPGVPLLVVVGPRPQGGEGGEFSCRLHSLEEGRRRGNIHGDIITLYPTYAPAPITAPFTSLLFRELLTLPPLLPPPPPPPLPPPPFLLPCTPTTTRATSKTASSQALMVCLQVSTVRSGGRTDRVQPAHLCAPGTLTNLLLPHNGQVVTFIEDLIGTN